MFCTCFSTERTLSTKDLARFETAAHFQTGLFGLAFVPKQDHSYQSKSVSGSRQVTVPQIDGHDF
jgi:hypothetical protein